MTPVYLTPFLRQQIKIAAAEKGMTMTGYIEQAAKQTLESERKAIDDTEFYTLHLTEGGEHRADYATWDPMGVVMHDRMNDGTLSQESRYAYWGDVTHIEWTRTDAIGARVTTQVYPHLCLDCGERVQETPSRTAWRSTHVCAPVDNQKGE